MYRGRPKHIICFVARGASRAVAVASPPRPFRRPRHPILGSDIAGCVEAVGKDVREYRPGDEVFGEMPGYHGALAEYVRVPETAISPKPATLSFDEAATLAQAGAIALRGISHARAGEIEIDLPRIVHRRT